MSGMQSRAARLEAVLTQAFSPTLLRVVDDSAQHAGHAGAQPGGETHYSVLLVSAAFHGMNRVARSRAVHAALAAEFSGGHARAVTDTSHTGGSKAARDRLTASEKILLHAPGARTPSRQISAMSSGTGWGG